jgi:hypothetical protein
LSLIKMMKGVAIGLALVAAACGDPATPAAPTPVPATVTETFNGTLSVAGNNTHAFTVAQVGALRVIVDNVSPSAVVGVGVGAPAAAVCNVVEHANAVAGATVQLSGNATVAGTFCVSVYDVGNLVEPVNYTITVVHS